MGHSRLQEVRLRNFRCFAETQTAKLARLTLLVGENSTGKTSFLAAVRAAWRLAYGSGDAGFNDPPYRLGAYSEIAHASRIRQPSASSFTLGFRNLSGGSPIDIDITFEPSDFVSHPARTRWSCGDAWVQQSMLNGDIAEVTFGAGTRDWRIGDPTNTEGRRLYAPAICNAIERELDGERLAAFSPLIAYFDSKRGIREPYASAPIRANPERTYDPKGAASDPWGANAPNVLAGLIEDDPSELRRHIEIFGQQSGLFDDIEVTRLGKWDGAPFQVLVRKYGHGNRKGPKRNLIDVGFGVSQVLPVLIEVFQAQAPELFLFQQPEVHLHPSAQAALGTLFCEVAASGKQILVETHSDYLLDRVRMEIRDGGTGLTPTDVSILYFQRHGMGVLIHSLRFDKNGNVLDAPIGYRQFFMEETRRSVGL